MYSVKEVVESLFLLMALGRGFMGVLSKVLRFNTLAAKIVPVGCTVLFIGCAASQSSVTDTGDTLASSTTASSQVSESSLVDASAGGSVVAAADTNVSSEELINSTDAGIGVRVERGNGFSRFLVDLNNPEPVFDVTMIKNPSRLVVDILGEKGLGNKEVALNEDDFLKSIRLGKHKDKARLVFDLKPGVDSEVPHEVDSQNGKLMVTFHTPETTSLPSVAPTTAQATSEETVEVALNPTPVEPVLAEKDAVEASAPQIAESDVSIVEPAAAPKIETARAVTVDSLTFEKNKANAGEVTIGLSEPTAFELRKSAPSEYVLTLGGASAATMTTYPQIAPKGFPGIRSARATQVGESTSIRMFVDPGVDLSASAKDNSIIVTAANAPAPGTAQFDPTARAQLETGDTPQGKDNKAVTEPDENVARENPTGVTSSDGAKRYTGRLISLDLQDTDIDNALRIIAEVSNLNIIASDDVTGKVTLRLIDVPWDQALDVILKTNGLDQVTEGNVIRIAPIDKLRQEREALQAAKKAAEQLKELTVDYIRVSYARATELKEQVESVLSERGTVTVDERTNQLIIKDTGDAHVRAKELLAKLDLRTPQVLLETQIVESSRNLLRDLGFQWNFSYVQSPATGNATGLNFPNSVTTSGASAFPATIDTTTGPGTAIAAVLDSADGSRSLSARISALEQDRKVKVISRPQVATVNNKQAEISSVETIRVRTPSSGTAISTGSGANSSSGASTAFEEIKVGIELKVTPQASPDYYVLLDVNAKSSTLGSNQVDQIPSTLDREATSTVLVKSGQTFALGGVYRLEDADTVPGIPFLKDIPVLGVLFRQTLIDKSDEELIFFITPHIVEGSFDPSLM